MTDTYSTPGILAGRQRVSAEDLAYQELRSMLAARKLTPGGTLSEEALAATLGVSRTPLRQALTRLRFEGLVDRAPNGRLFATPMSLDDARDLFRVRIALEQLALEQAFQHLDEPLLASLRSILAQMAAIGRAGQRTVAEYGGEFHATLYRAGKNTLNMALLGQLQGRIDRYRFLSTATGRKRQRDAVREHQVILNALENGDLTIAHEALGEHLASAERSVIAALTVLSDAPAD